MLADIARNDIDTYRICLWKCYEIIEAWYEHYDHRPHEIKLLHKKRRYHIWLSQMGRLVQTGSLLVEYDHGVSSGKNRTSSLVSMIRHIDYMAASMRLLHQHYPTEANRILNDDVLLYNTFRMIHYGDDAARSVTPNFPLINNNSIHEVLLEEHGIETTNPDKADKSRPPDYQTREQFDFLSRDAESRLREDTIQNIVLWRKDDATPDREALPELCNSALDEWFHYGVERHNRERDKYTVELARLGLIDVPLTTYEVRHANWVQNY
jgi:hypothetical protein